MDKKELIEAIKEFCDDYGLYFTDDYSGRGMYGEKCIGIVTGGSIAEMLIDLCDYLHAAGIEMVGEYITSVKQDSMGLDKIVYFPELSI